MNERYSNRPGSSSRWALWRRMVLRSHEGVYLDRLRIVQTPWFAAYLHRLEGPDPGLDLHDHPWTFVTTVLWGGYTEQRAEIRSLTQEWGMTQYEHRRRWRPRRMRLDECHRIVRLDRRPTWTLVLCGARVRNWGFYTPDGFVRHNLYDDSERRPLVVQDG